MADSSAAKAKAAAGRDQACLAPEPSKLFSHTSGLVALSLPRPSSSLSTGCHTPVAKERLGVPSQRQVILGLVNKTGGVQSLKGTSSPKPTLGRRDKGSVRGRGIVS